jgi:hypothetical protein
MELVSWTTNLKKEDIGDDLQTDGKISSQKNGFLIGQWAKFLEKKEMIKVYSFVFIGTRICSYSVLYKQEIASHALLKFLAVLSFGCK